MSNWKESRIAEFGRIITGYTPSTQNLKLWDGEIPFYSPADFKDDVYCLDTERKVKKEAISNDRIVKENSLMVTCIASIGKIALAKKEGISNQQINTIIFNDNFNHEYCYYLIKHNINELIKLAGITAVPIVNKAEFEKIVLKHHVDKPTQRKIARILSTADAVIEKTQAAIAKYKAIKQGMLHDLFTRGILMEDYSYKDKNGKVVELRRNQLRPKYEDAPELYKQSKLGWIPKEWEVEKLGDKAIIDYGKSQKQVVSLNGTIPVYGTGGLMEYATDYLFDGASILIGRKGTIDKPFYIEGKFWTVDTAYYLSHFSGSVRWLHSQLENFNLKRINEATGVPSINREQLYGILLSFPKELEQVEIVKRIKSINNKIQTEQTYLQKLQQIKAGLMADLLSGKKAVTV